jgi:hypothetical protein
VHRRVLRLRDELAGVAHPLLIYIYMCVSFTPFLHFWISLCFLSPFRALLPSITFSVGFIRFPVEKLSWYHFRLVEHSQNFRM